MVKTKFISDPSPEELARFGALIRQKQLSVDEVSSILRAYPVEMDVSIYELGGIGGYELKGKWDETGIKSGIAIVIQQRIAQIKEGEK